MNKSLFKIPSRKKPTNAKFVIGPGDPNKNQTIPRGFDGRGYAVGLGDTNVVGAVPTGDAGAGSAIVASVDTPNPVIQDDDDTPYKHGCIMLAISDAISEWITNWTKNNINTNDLYIDEDSGIDGYETEHHISLLYGVDEINPDALNDLIFGMLENIPDIVFGDVSRFDTNPEFDVIKIAIKTPLDDMHKLLCENVMHVDVFDEFVPHITLAYIKKNTCKNIDGNRDFVALKDKPEEIIFSNKTGEQHVYGLVPDTESTVAMG